MENNGNAGTNSTTRTPILDDRFVGWSQVSLVPSNDKSEETIEWHKSSTIAYLKDLEDYLRGQSFPDKPLTLSIEIDSRETQDGGASQFLTISVGPGSKQEFCLGGLSALGLKSEHGQQQIRYLREQLIPSIVLAAFSTAALVVNNVKYVLDDNPPESYTVLIPQGRHRTHGGQRRAFLQGTPEQRANVAGSYKALLPFWKKQLPRLCDEFPDKWREMAQQAHADITPELYIAFEKKVMKAEHLALTHACLRHGVKITRPDNKPVGLTQLREFRRSGEKILLASHKSRS
jgi:hypothetical protein